MKSTRTHRKLRLGVTAALSVSILALAGCGQIYPSTEPANGPANGTKSNVHDVVVGFAQQQLQAPYFAAMQVRAEQIANVSWQFAQQWAQDVADCCVNC